MCVSGGVQTFAELSHLFETFSPWYSNPLSPAWNYPKFSSISTILNPGMESLLCQSMHGTQTYWFSLWVECTDAMQAPWLKAQEKSQKSLGHGTTSSWNPVPFISGNDVGNLLPQRMRQCVMLKYYKPLRGVSLLLNWQMPHSSSVPTYSNSCLRDEVQLTSTRQVRLLTAPGRSQVLQSAAGAVNECLQLLKVLLVRQPWLQHCHLPRNPRSH